MRMNRIIGIIAVAGLGVMPVCAQNQDINDASVKGYSHAGNVRLSSQPLENDAGVEDSLRQARQLRDLSRVANGMERSPYYDYDIPYYTGMPVWGGYQWDLHKGMNVSLSASAFVTSGNRQYFPGSGFSTDASMMYVMPVNKKLTVAVGGYASTNNFGRYQFNDFGIQGMAAYHFNDKLNLYAYGRYSFINPKIPYPVRAMAPFLKSSSTFGGVLDYKVTPSIRFQVGIRSDQYHY